MIGMCVCVGGHGYVVTCVWRSENTLGAIYWLPPYLEQGVRVVHAVHTRLAGREPRGSPCLCLLSRCRSWDHRGKLLLTDPHRVRVGGANARAVRASLWSHSLAPQMDGDAHHNTVTAEAWKQAKHCRRCTRERNSSTITEHLLSSGEAPRLPQIISSSSRFCCFVNFVNEESGTQ